MKTFARGRALRLVGGVAGMAAGLLALSGCSEEHAADPQWTVLQQIEGPRGEDLPLRSGRADAESDGHGFGRRHIQEDQGYVPSAADMHTVLTQAPECREGLDPAGADTTCAAEIGGKRLVVVATTRIAPESGDNRPIGIIAAYYEGAGS
ncbi:hypothetical protein L1O03_09240 [Corynebacterium uropygiale]|uniref:DUF4333 domain-containing protein n=1 Tax=Corynebacterium uropygiale TaxID=1775911 RepID=A0A9X1U1A6_9CORY|nr:hypothetical protein [Corynebacterium uropygiale]MCF4007353.1 hypothetical protein [Corynebacterium uropygiale]